MGANISILARAIRTVFRSVRRMIVDWDPDQDRRANMGLPSAQRPLTFRNGVRNFCTLREGGSLEVICCERGAECKLYVTIYNQRNIPITYTTIYQDAATNLNSLVEVFWLNPRTGNPDALTFTYPVEVRAIRDLFA